jgi:putative sterol carrier protein
MRMRDADAAASIARHCCGRRGRTFQPSSERTVMSLQTSTETLRTRVGADCGLGAVLKFDCGDAGVVVIDGRSAPNTVDNVNRDADCTITITEATLDDLISGELEPTTGFMTGRFKVAGDMSVALKLQRVL